MASTHREGAVFYHEGERVTHYETGTASEPVPEPAVEPEPGPATPVAAPEPIHPKPVASEHAPKKPARKAKKAKT